MRPQQRSTVHRAGHRFAPVSIGTTGARNLNDRVEAVCGSMTLLVYMNGHVGCVPVSDSLWVSVDRSNLCRSLMLAFVAACRGGTSTCPNTPTHQSVYLCRHGSP